MHIFNVCYLGVIFFYAHFTAEFECSPGYAKCSSGYCIPVHYLCNGRSDCLDNSDEESCESKSQLFTSYSINSVDFISRFDIKPT